MTSGPRSVGPYIGRRTGLGLAYLSEGGVKHPPPHAPPRSRLDRQGRANGPGRALAVMRCNPIARRRPRLAEWERPATRSDPIGEVPATICPSGVLPQSRDSLLSAGAWTIT
jgi:hypothetical protein